LIFYYPHLEIFFEDDVLPLLQRSLKGTVSPDLIFFRTGIVEQDFVMTYEKLDYLNLAKFHSEYYPYTVY
jgi:hypothetical protein